jgi:uncharacterized damage-inducible protein DinB
LGEECIKIVNKFGEYRNWITVLKNIDTNTWFTPISKGKWSISEVVSHIYNWDNHLIFEIIPCVKRGQGMEFPDFDSYNKKASEYAKSGVSQLDLINNAIAVRETIVNTLLKVSEQDLCKPLTSNGVSHCPHTGESYSLIYIIKEFIEHDKHHIQQITQYLNQTA